MYHVRQSNGEYWLRDVFEQTVWSSGIAYGDKPDDSLRWDPRARFTLVGHAISAAYPMVSNNDPSTARDAALSRLYAELKSAPDDTVWDKVDEVFEQVDLLGDCVGKIEPMTVEAWIKSMRSGRRKALARAAEEYRRDGWQTFYASFSSFVKMEFLPRFEVKEGVLVLKAEYKPRMIQGPHDAGHVICGPYLKALMHSWKKVMNGNGSRPLYASCSPERLDAWFNANFKEGVTNLIMCDYSKFDRTIRKRAWQFMERWYRSKFHQLPPDWDKVMDAWREPRGKVAAGEHKLRFKAEVCNASGRDDTALANARLNVVVLLFSLSAVEHRVAIEALTAEQIRHTMQKHQISIVGDDSLVLYQDDFTPQMKQEFTNNIARFGFEAGGDKCIVSKDPFDAVYLGQRPYPIAGSDLYAFGPTLGRRLYKHHYMLKPGDPYAWLTGVAVMEERCFPHVPVLWDMAKNVLELRKGMKRTPYADDAAQYKLLERLNALPRYDERTIEYLANGYKVGKAVIYQTLERVRSNKTLPVVWDDDFLSIVASMDAL